MSGVSEKAMEARARRIAARNGCRAIKCRREDPLDNYGGFMVLDLQLNIPVAGWKFSMSAEDVIAYFNE